MERVIKLKSSSKKILLAWIFVLFVSFVLRIYGLGLNPIGISHDDELNEMLNAKSIAITGSPRPGFVAGILTKTDHCQFFGDCVYGELGTIFQVPWLIAFPLDLATSRIFFVIIYVLLTLIAGKLFENLSKNPWIGILAGLFVAINPWGIYFGRTAHTILISHLLYLFAAYLFTRQRSVKSNLIFGGLAAGVASLVYFGGKSILPFILIWGALYNFYQFKKPALKTIGVFLIISFSLVACYFYLLKNSYAGSRISDVGNVQENVKTIELGGPAAWSVGRQIDKVTPRVESFLGFFSPTSLFLTGQRAEDSYYLSGHGYFYLIDFVFLFFGVMALSKKPIVGVFLFGLITISVLPVAIKTSETSAYSHRASLAYPLISGLIGWGVFYATSLIKNLKNGLILKLFLFGVGFLYAISLLYFLFVYWYRVPVELSTRWFFAERVLANYISRSGDKKFVILSSRPDGIFNSYVFYAGIYNEENTIREVNKAYENRNYQYGNVLFIDDCSKLTDIKKPENVIFVDQINNPNCEFITSSASITNPKDAGAIFSIANETLCKNFDLQNYPYPQNIRDFSIENQTNEVFCKNWITR